MAVRTIEKLIHGMPASDGAGVKLTRSLGASQALRVDPFLMLDEFASDDAADYIAGFPPHPHRGFETVTYMLEGHMLHEDHLGNKGHLRDGAVQWMTAGRGVIHSEMPQQNEGRMRGFQLWINLPAAEKMKPAHYRDIPAEQIPVAVDAGGVSVKLIAGELDHAGEHMVAPINGLSTQPFYADVTLPADAVFRLPLPPAHNAFVYVVDGTVSVGGGEVPKAAAAVLSHGDILEVVAAGRGGRVLVLAGKPIGEPIEQYGPFVMNTRDEIEQALRDYRDGTLAQAS